MAALCKDKGVVVVRSTAFKVPIAMMVLAGMLIAVPLSAAPIFPRVMSSATVEGIIASISVPAAALRIRTPAGRDMLVWLHAATKFEVTRTDVEAELRRSSISDFRSGDHVRVTGFALDDSRLLALRVRVLNRSLPDIRTAIGVPAARQARQAVVRGVVVERDPATLVVVDTNGSLYRIVVTVATQAKGQKKSPAAIAPYDIVRVEGSRNPDGSISAENVEVIAAPHGLVEGRIVARSARGPAFLALESTDVVRAFSGRLIVNVSPDASIISRGRLQSFSDLRVGQTIRAIGTLIVVGTVVEGGAVLGFDANVIIF